MEIEFKPLKERVNEKIKYVKAWNLIEKAKSFHKREQHLNAKECYREASEILVNLPSFNYESNYYGAWVFLEEAEELSKQENYRVAISSYKKSITLWIFFNFHFIPIFILRIIKNIKNNK